MTDFLEGTIYIISFIDIMAAISYLMILAEITLGYSIITRSFIPAMLYIQNARPKTTRLQRDVPINMDYAINWETFMSDNYSRFLEGPAIPKIPSRKEKSTLSPAKELDKNNDIENISILKVVHEVIRIYHIESWDSSRITLLDKSEDFNFCGSHALFKRVIYSLLVNSMKCSEKKAKIDIWTEGRTLYLKNSTYIAEPDSGKPIAILSHANNIPSPGLIFCDTVIRKMGGSIAFRYDFDKYIEFIITLPNPEKTDPVTP
jgi:hypothetical protein